MNVDESERLTASVQSAIERDRAISGNLKGAYRLCQRSLKYMIEQAEAEREVGEEVGHRSFLFIATVSDVAPDSMRIPYGVSKAGLNHVVLGAAVEGGRHNITVNALRPGVVETPLRARSQNGLSARGNRQVRKSWQGGLTG